MKIKQMTNKGRHIERSPLFDTKIGEVDLFTGIMSINYELDDFNHQFQSQKSNINKDFWDLMHHETFHFIQIFSTGYLFNITMNMYNNTLGIVDKLQQSDKPLKLSTIHAKLSKYKISNEFLKLDKQHEVTINSIDSESSSLYITARDITESMVIFSSFRSIHSTVSKKLFNEWSDKKGYSKYLSPFTYAHHILGDSVLNSFTEFCFWSLNTDNPSSSFIKLLQATGYSGVTEERELDKDDLINILKIEDIKIVHSIEIYHKFNNVNITHPYFEMYIYKLQKRAAEKTNSTYTLISKPYETTREVINDFLPQILRLKQGKIRITVPGERNNYVTDNENTLVHVLSLMQAIHGAILVLTKSIKFPHIQCHHVECPYHTENVCVQYHRIPISWDKCSFPSLLEEYLMIEKLF